MQWLRQVMGKPPLETVRADILKTVKTAGWKKRSEYAFFSSFPIHERIGFVESQVGRMITGGVFLVEKPGGQLVLYHVNESEIREARKTGTPVNLSARYFRASTNPDLILKIVTALKNNPSHPAFMANTHGEFVS